MQLNRIEERKIENFLERWEANSTIAKVDKFASRSWITGSPMYYYCKACGAFITALPECHIGPRPQLCEDCEDLRRDALFTTALKRIPERKATMNSLKHEADKRQPRECDGA